MDSRERAKATRKLLEITRNPEMASIARELFCSEGETAKPADPQTVRPARTILSHWVIAVVAGIAVSWTGELAVDSWLLLRNTPRGVAWATGLAVVLLVVFGIVGYSMYRNFLSAQQKDTFKHLEAFASMSASNNPLESRFMVKNGGDNAIGERMIKCWPIMMALADGEAATTFRAISEVFPVTKARMDLGDAETNKCLQLVGPQNLGCVDMWLSIEYVLASQPKVHKSKTWRFVATPSAGIFQWDEQPAGETGSYCTPYLTEKAKEDYMRDALKSTERK